MAGVMDQVVDIVDEDLAYVLDTSSIKRKDIMRAFMDYLDSEDLYGKNKNEVVLDSTLAGLVKKKAGAKVTRASLLKLTGKVGMENGYVEY